MELTDKEEEKGLVIALADAVVDPGAVMVHSQHTSPAHPAVMSARRLRPFALLAEPRATAL